MAARSSGPSSAPHMSSSGANMDVQLAHVIDVVDVVEEAGAGEHSQRTRARERERDREREMESGPSAADREGAPHSQGAFNGGSSAVGLLEESIICSQEGLNSLHCASFGASPAGADGLQSSSPFPILSTTNSNVYQSSSGSGGSSSPAASDPAETMAARSSGHSSAPNMRSSGAHMIDVVEAGAGAGTVVGQPVDAAGTMVGGTVVGDPVAGGPVQQRARLQTREQRLRSLQESVPHRMKWEHLKKEEKHFQKEGSTHKRGVRRLSKELYVILSWYALLQSGIFAAVGQTTLFECNDLWWLVAVVAMVTLGTIMASVDKLHSMGRHQRQVVMFQVRHNAVYDVIEHLRIHGANYDLNLEPGHSLDYDARRPSSLALLCSPHGLLVLLFLLGFSALNMICCFAMLCSHCKCHAS